jgi:hypothetical protein
MYSMMVLFGRDKAHVLYHRAGSSCLLGLGKGRLVMLNSVGGGEWSCRVLTRRWLIRPCSWVVPSAESGQWGVGRRYERLWPLCRNSRWIAYLEER